MGTLRYVKHYSKSFDIRTVMFMQTYEGLIMEIILYRNLNGANGKSKKNDIYQSSSRLNLFHNQLTVCFHEVTLKP